MPWQAQYALLASIWGLSFMLIKIGNETLDPIQVSFGRMIVGTAVLGAIVHVKRERLPRGLEESARLDDPIFTPATKAITGHDENISRAQLAAALGRDLAKQLEETTIALYRHAHAYAVGQGLILADTKFEFGLIDGQLVLIDEALTPDSSRYWDAATYRPGAAPPSFDKQFVRDYLDAQGWRHEPPAPALPDEVVRGTSERYRECYQKLTGKAL